MNNVRSFIIFIFMALTVYFGFNGYLFVRITHGAGLTGGNVWLLRILLLIAIFAFPLQHACRFAFSIERWFAWIAAVWLAIMLYGFMIALTVDLVRISQLLFHWLPSWITADRIKTGRIVLLASTAAVALMLLSGYRTALHPRIARLKLPLPKYHSAQPSYRVLLFSDVHLGALVGKDRLTALVDRINSENPDLVLIAGDLIDEPVSHLTWAEEELRRIKAPDGIYAVTGNHEYYAGLKPFLRWMDSLNIPVLENRAVQIRDVLVVAGVDDVTATRQFHIELPSLDQILQGVDRSLPVIFLHHTPTRQKEAVANGVDLMVSGHTHNGQMWPLKYVTTAIYGFEAGLTRIGEMYFYQLSGAGTWGPPFRVLTPPDMLVVDLTFVVAPQGSL